MPAQISIPASRARLSYRQLIKIAEITPYNMEATDKLMRFDYAGFMKENSLNPYIFKTVEDYLSRGDITGAFKQAYSSMVTIKELSITVRNEISLNSLPAVQVCWKLNERISEASLFGSYAARVFHTAF